eukprot:CAMPEP_0196592254 /NCGR_PEP_ID=MMETSP1081-20130531/72215_1 /TAXON_ID=36882 /ORGANISM="Pyramimonas amylifera, Strain CCMP720" /LENGTH=128 /DNA_ID=CAMNT_0041915871 /DNA_START=474 /DNA_END=860 /DNA_ORIENTATION=+
MVLPVRCSKCGGTLEGADTIAAVANAPDDPPRARVSSTTTISARNNLGPAPHSANNGTNPSLAAMRVRSSLASEGPAHARNHQLTGTIFPIRSAKLKAVIRTMGYQSPSAADLTSSAKKPGKMARVTM